MPVKFNCELSTGELKKLYFEDGLTIKELCPVVGVKSDITMRKILHERGIDTNANQRLANKTRNGMTEEEFEKYLREEYANSKSMADIAANLGVTPSAVRKYFVKYDIDRKSTTWKFEGNPENSTNWNGGVHIKSSGYVEVYCPDHPNANSRKCVYEHQLVMEKHIGRYIQKGEVVHHIDGNKSNNDISNLLLLTNSDHAKLHAILRRSKRLMNNRG